MRLIDADALIESLSKNCPEDPMTEAIVEIFKACVDSEPTIEAESQWIPCSSGELPKKNGVYLACYEDVTVPLDWFNGKWFFYKSNPAVEETGSIIAWMPMPKPYKEGEEE